MGSARGGEIDLAPGSHPRCGVAAGTAGVGMDGGGGGGGGVVGGKGLGIKGQAAQGDPEQSARGSISECAAVVLVLLRAREVVAVCGGVAWLFVPALAVTTSWDLS